MAKSEGQTFTYPEKKHFSNLFQQYIENLKKDSTYVKL